MHEGGVSFVGLFCFGDDLDCVVEVRGLGHVLVGF